jgi:hypothetical protein
VNNASLNVHNKQGRLFCDHRKFQCVAALALPLPFWLSAALVPYVYPLMSHASLAAFHSHAISLLLVGCWRRAIDTD